MDFRQGGLWGPQWPYDSSVCRILSSGQWATNSTNRRTIQASLGLYSSVILMFSPNCLASFLQRRECCDVILPHILYKTKRHRKSAGFICVPPLSSNGTNRAEWTDCIKRMSWQHGTQTSHWTQTLLLHVKLFLFSSGTLWRYLKSITQWGGIMSALFGPSVKCGEKKKQSRVYRQNLWVKRAFGYSLLA